MNTIDKNKSIALEASAGTGKTYQLSMRVVGMLLDDVPPKDILCLTFTRKATIEMLDRILQLLDDLVSGKISETDMAALEPLLKQQAKKRGIKYDITYPAATAKKARDRLLAEFSSLSVKTIDAFFNQILKAFPFEAQLRPDYSIEDDAAIRETQAEAYGIVITSLLENEDWKNILRKSMDVLNESAKNIINKLFGYAAFTEGNFIALEALINSTDTSAAAVISELNAAINAKNKAESALDIFLDNISAYDDLSDAQRKAVESVMNKEDFFEKITTGFVDNSPENHRSFKKYDFPSQDMEMFEQFKSYTCMYFRHKSESAKLLSLTLGNLLHIECAKLKSTKNIITYRDINEITYKMLASEESPIGKDYLYFRLDGKINHILVDEFQDTSLIQWLVLQPLAEEALAGIGQHDKTGSFFYVGDLKQNLYRFRGGSTVLFDSILEEYDGKIEKETLGVNYRSDSNIVEFVNIVCTKAAKYFETDAFQVFDIDQSVPDGREAGYVEADYRGEGVDEGQFTVIKVMEALAAGFSYGDIAVLVPKNDTGAKVAEALADEGIPVLTETNQRLSGTSVFKTIMALANFIETGSLSSFCTYALTSAFDITLKDFADTGTRTAVMNVISTSVEPLANKTIFEKLIAVMKERGTYDRFNNEPDFAQTLDIIAAYASDEKNITEFNDTVTKAAAAAASVSAKMKNAVTVMTVHKSKGLQFPLVIVPSLAFSMEVSSQNTSFVLIDKKDSDTQLEFLNSKKYSSYFDEQQTEAIETENELIRQDAMNRMYVALTRAKNALIVGIDQLPKTSENITNIGRLLPSFVSLAYQEGTLSCTTKSEHEHEPDEQRIDISKFECQKSDEFKRPAPESFVAAITGTALHAAAFLLEGFDEESINNAFNAVLSSYGAYLNEKERAQLLGSIRALAENEHFRNLFSGRIFRERKIADGGALFSIDVYSVLDDKIILADYKTGEINEKRLVEYKEQLNKYESLLFNIYKLPVTKYLFHFYNGSVSIRQC